MAEVIKLPLRSVSQINQYTRCPMAYKLSRIDKEWARPAAWLPQGSAVHTVLEHVELSIIEGKPMELEEAKELFRSEYAKEVHRYTDGPDEARRTPNLNWWTWSGPHNGPADIERRWGIGQEQIEKFYAWRAGHAREVWVTPDGKPAIELYFEIELSGIKVRGYIDAVDVVDGKLRVRDYKTGNSPGDDFQLGVYSVAIEILYGVKPLLGDYYMAGKKGAKAKTTVPYDLSEWTVEAVTARFHEVEKFIQAGEFPALPETDKCKFCDVSRACPVFQSQ